MKEEDEIEALATESVNDGKWGYPQDEVGQMMFDTCKEYFVEGYKAASKEEVSGNVLLPTIDEAGIAAVKLSEKLFPNLAANEEAMLVAGFQECIKWLSVKGVAKEEVSWDEADEAFFIFYQENKMKHEYINLSGNVTKLMWLKENYNLTKK